MLRDFVLGPRVADHAAAFAQTTPGEADEPATPRQASTVALLRDGASGPETFLLRRVASMPFAARMNVFPGGGVDPRDSDADVPWAGPPVEQWARRLDVAPGQAAGLVCAAVRELFEECGVLLAGTGPDDVAADLGGDSRGDDSRGDDSWEQDRLALLDRSLALSQLLVRRGLVLRSDLLRPWGHWCTPVFEPRRYDTWFFLAELPAGQRARDVGGEADQAEWVPAACAIEGFEAGEVALMPPTLVTLEEIAAAGDVASLLAAERRISRLMPWLATRADEQGAQGEQDVVIRVDLDGDGGGRPGPASGFEGRR